MPGQRRVSGRTGQVTWSAPAGPNADYRYGYSAVIGEFSRATNHPSGGFADQAFANVLLKHDLATATVQAHEFGPDATAGEAVFAPATPAADEDDGYVMAFVVLTITSMLIVMMTVWLGR